MTKKIRTLIDRLPEEHRRGLELFIELEQLERGPMSEEEVLYRYAFNAPPPTTPSQRLLHAYRVHLGTPAKPASIYKLAKLLPLTGPRLYQIKEGDGGAMSDNVVDAICQDLYKDDPNLDARTDQWLCEIAAERAECNHQPELAERWRRIATRLAALAFPLLLWLPTDVEALAAQAERTPDGAPYKYYVKRLLSWLRRLAAAARPPSQAAYAAV